MINTQSDSGSRDRFFVENNCKKCGRFANFEIVAKSQVIY